MQVVKATGEKEPFDSDKLCESIRRAGAPEELANNVCGIVSQKITPDVTTSQIFRRTLGFLMKENIEISARYSLRRGVSSLGPAGFRFEQYIEAILQAHGFTTERNVMMKGKCIEHEIDVLAKKDDMVCLIEAKYHNESGKKTGINEVMYADARLIDIARKHTDKMFDDSHHQVWVVTNTKFTQKAIQYGRCRRMRIIGWNYPGRENLQELITSKKVYPITVLPSVSHFEREKFAERDMILARDVLPYSASDLINDFGIPPQIASKIVDEAQKLVN